jgi:hypothetical protein
MPGVSTVRLKGIADLRAALETIGITRTILTRSSWSGGLHLYLPFPDPVNTFNLAVALKECLKSQGFRLRPGQLELFPNVKAYGVQAFIDYNAHRLPLQPASGSCLLDDDLNPIGDSLARFFWLWDGSAGHQDMEALQEAFRIGRMNHRKRPKRRSHPVDSWRQDLDTELTEGWTDYGQTNRMLKTIACYGRVFEGLQGQELIDYTLRIATTRPGYEQYCRHQHDIERKVTAWARAAEQYYWPLGTTPARETDTPHDKRVSHNQQQSEDAQNRIRAVYIDLEQAGELPEQITARAAAISQHAKVSQQTLYKHLSLWHPRHQPGVIAELSSFSAVEQPQIEDGAESLDSLQGEALHPLEKNMKCEALRADGDGSDFESFSPERGVRGDDGLIPQVAESPDAELQAQVQRQIYKLGWTYDMIRQFSADRFEGKRWLDLNGEEQLLLLYYLQTAVLE